MMGRSMRSMIVYGLCRPRRRKQEVTLKQIQAQLARLRQELAAAQVRSTEARLARELIEERRFGHIPKDRSDYRRLFS